MNSGGAEKKVPVRGVETDPDKLQKQIKEYQSLLRQGFSGRTTPAEIKKGVADSQFVERVFHLSQHIHTLIPKVDSSKVYQTFRLAGRDQLVHDRRDKPEAKKEAQEAKAPTKELWLKEGKLVGEKAKKYENFLADPEARFTMVETEAAEARFAQLLTKFEEMLLARFEGGRSLERPLQKEETSFLKKTLEQWRTFFSHFARRTIAKTTDLQQLERLVFRDLVAGKRKTLISDLFFRSGALEKFVRLSLVNANVALLARLTQATPGSLVDAALWNGLFGDGEIRYLGIQEGGGRELEIARAPTMGQFLTTAKAEEKAREALGMPLSDQLRAKTKILREGGKKRRGAGAGLFEGDAESETPQVFVPGFQQFPEERIGKWRWFVPVVISVMIIVLAVLVWGLFRSF